MVQVTFLGTGAAFTNRHRTNIALLVQEGDTRLLVECGPTVLYQLAQAGSRADRIEYLFISHRHGDHILGLPMLLLMRSKLMRSKEGAYESLTVLGSAETVQAGKDLTHIVFPDHSERLMRLAWVEMPSDQRGTVELEPRITVSTLPRPHSPHVPVLALRLDFRDSGHSLVYTGDTIFDETMADFAAGCDLLVHEANFSEALQPGIDAEMYGHSTARQAGRIASQADCRILALVHLDPSYVGREDEVRADAAQEFSGPIIIPNDGATVYL